MADKKISELTALIATTVAGDDEMALVDTSVSETKKITSSSSAIYSDITKHYTDSGSADTYALTSIAGFTPVYTTGMTVRFTPANDNTGSSTVNLESLGAKTVKKVDAGGSKVNLAGGDLVAGVYYVVVYDGTDFVMLKQTGVNQNKDFNLRVINNTTNPTYQIDITFDSWTFYNDAGDSVVESRTSALTLDITVVGAGGRAIDVTQEGSSSEQANMWYYPHVYSDGAGTINGILSTQQYWEDVAATDKPPGSTFVRTLSSVNNAKGGSNLDFFLMDQTDSFVSMESSSVTNIAAGVTQTTPALSVDISAAIPKNAYAMKITATNTGSGNTSYIAGTNVVSPLGFTAPGVGGMQATAGNNNELTVNIGTPQTCYVNVNAGTGGYGTAAFWIRI